MSHSPGRRRRRARSGTPAAARAASRLSAVAALALLPGALLVVPAHPVAAQQPAQGVGRIAGTVVAEGARPVSGVQVTVVGTRFGALTDDQGKYNIGGVPAGQVTVRTQRIGFQPRTQQVSVRAGQVTALDFQLTTAATQLSAVQVVGYTNEARRDVSGSVTQVTGNEIRDQKVATVEEALRGRAPGVQIAATGQPGRPAQIIIRGQNGFNSPNPLYVVDGMYVGQQNPNINPDDIATINILKDASAAAQYGAQASNGVVVITTRRGAAGQNQFALNTYYGFQSIPKRLPLAGAQQWQQIYLNAYKAAGITPPSGVQTLSGVNTDWQNAVFRTGDIQNYNLQASGGTTTANYLISGSVLNQGGTVMNTNFRRYSLRANSEAQLGRVTIGENLAVSRGDQNSFPQGVQGGTALPLIDVAGLLPVIPVRDPNNPGGYGYGSPALPNYGTNPVAALEKNYNRFRSNQVLGTAYGDVKLFGGLRYHTNLGINYADSLNSQWTSATQLRYLTAVLTGASLRESRPNATNLLWENLLNYDANLGDGAHRITAVAGQSSQNNNFTQLTAFRQGFSNEGLQQLDAGSTSGFNNGGYAIPFRTNSLLARATYAFHDRYLLTGSVRHDCSSRFSPNNKCGNFGAGSVGYVVSEEGFFKSIPVIGGADFLKFRASTGVLGDQNFADLSYLVPITQNINYLNGNTTVITGATQLGVPNTNLKWQRNRSSDFGLDLGLFRNALTITADYYDNRADQILVSLPVPSSLGSFNQNGSPANPVFNAGRVRNAGFEFGAQHRMDQGTFRMNTTFTLSTTANRVLSLGNGGQPIYAGPNYGGGQVAITRVGDPIGSFYVRRTCGIFQSAAQVAAHTSTVNGKPVVIQPNAQPGDLCFVDANNDGVINDGDRQIAGSPIPKVQSGLFLEPRYRNFDFGLNLRGAFGNKIYNAVRLTTERTIGLNNVRSDFNPWTPTNTNTSTPRAVFGDAVNGDPITDRWLESGNFVRIQNLIVGYTLPNTVLRQLRVGNSNAPRIYVNVQNLATLTKYKGYDPEVLGFGDPLSRGIDDGFIYPNPRTVTFGLDVRF